MESCARRYSRRTLQAGKLELGSGRRELFLPLRSYFLEFLAGCRKEGLHPADRTKTAQAHVAIERIELDTKTAPASPLGRDEGRARAHKWI